MSRIEIDEILSAGNPLSEQVDFTDKDRVSVHVSRLSNSGAFVVTLEATLLGAGDWAVIGRFSDTKLTDTSSNLSVLNVGPSLSYRFRHVSGENVRVMLRN